MKKGEKLTLKSLVVEDDPLACMILLSILSKYGDCHIAVNGKEAVGAVKSSLEKKKPYDVMCLDILMPVLDGHNALVEIRRLEKEFGVRESEALKVIMVTAVEDFDNIIRAFEAGHCEAYLSKPVDEKKLLEHLYELDLLER